MKAATSLLRVDAVTVSDKRTFMIAPWAILDAETASGESGSESVKEQ